MRGVVVPAPKGKWKLQRGIASAVIKDDHHDAESDAEPEQVQHKFVDLCAERAAAHKAAAVGIMAELLAQCSREECEKREKGIKFRSKTKTGC